MKSLHSILFIHIYIYINIMRGKKDVTTFPDKPVSWIASLFRGLIYICMYNYVASRFLKKPIGDSCKTGTNCQQVINSI